MLPGCLVWKAWDRSFELTYAVTFGAELAIALTVRNPSDMEYSFEEALHTYFTSVKRHQTSHNRGSRRRPARRAGAPHTGSDLALQVGPRHRHQGN